jgi:predicted DNA-binding antitoxin AbrB/MazE fold protein
MTHNEVIMLAKTIKAKYKNGMLEPLGKVDLDLKDGATVTATIHEELSKDDKRREKALRSSFGGWKGLIDAEELIKNIYESRLITTRPLELNRRLS